MISCCTTRQAKGNVVFSKPERKDKHKVKNENEPKSWETVKCVKHLYPFICLVLTRVSSSKLYQNENGNEHEVCGSKAYYKVIHLHSNSLHDVVLPRVFQSE